YADEIERTLYNALLCGMKPDGTWGLRRLRFSHEHVPSPHHCGLQHHHCCLDNLPRGFFQASQMALMGDKDGFRCLLYNPGKGTIELPSGQNVEIRIDGNYPETGDVKLSLNLVEPEEFALKLRIPQWAEEIELAVNSDPIEAPRSRGWLVLQRTWESGDTVEIHLEMKLRCEYFDPSHLDPDDPLVGWSEQQWARIRDTRPEAPEHTLTVEDALPHRKAVAFLRGSVVLARDRRLGEQNLFAPMPEEFDPGADLSAQPAEPPAEIWQTFEIKGRGTSFSVCDFASAGNTWDPTSRFNAWLLPG
ncbi:MAG: glycoside hydrolase family 127 protein, partial [Planctomycetes bacterium]|nr:glycoside hydrolase family 127 protein [Planctomycetota bacterium]